MSTGMRGCYTWEYRENFDGLFYILLCGTTLVVVGAFGKNICSLIIL